MRSDPAKDTVLHAAPTAIKLWFSEPPTVAVSSIALADGAGKAVSLEKTRTEGPDPNLLMADVSGTLAPGTYSVSWKAASRDGHPVRGEFSFSIAKP